MSMNKIVLWICIDVDDWTAKWAIIASNVWGFLETLEKYRVDTP